MTDFIEQDALTTTPDTPPIRDHPHTVKSFVATPRVDEGFLSRVKGWLAGSTPNTPIVYKSADGLRHMFLITSNAYQDREGETITSEALKAYEASCYPGEDVFHCDNPLLWWHDDDVVMGEITAVNYVEPFLIETAKELDDPLSKILWDYAEKNGDGAGTSHRFGYLEGDKSADGVYTRIFKQETSYLPERALAANDRTYAGVLTPMATPQSDQRLSKIIEEATGLKDMAALIHTDINAAKKRLAEAGIMHKALPAAPVVEAAAEAAEDVTEDEVMESDMAVNDMPAFMGIMNQIYTLVMEMVDSQMSGMDQQMAFAKSLKAMEDRLEVQQVSEKAAKQTLEDEVKMLKMSLAVMEKRLNLAPRSVQREVGVSDPELVKKQIAESIDMAEGARKNSNIKHDALFGDLDLTKGY